MSTPNKLPSAVVSDILSTVRASHNHAVRRIYTDVSGSGAYTSQPREIALEQAKFAMMPGHAMRQMADCWTADQLASKFRNEVSHKNLSDEHGTYRYTEIPYRDALDCMPDPDRDSLVPKLVFLQAYDLGVDAMHMNTDTTQRQGTFFDTLVSAYSTDQSITSWGTVQQAFLHSSSPRRLLEQGFEQSLDELKHELRVTLLGPWPDLPEVLNEAAKSMTMSVLTGESGTA